jgi:hypothetical protein
METDAIVEKRIPVFPHRLAKPSGFRTVPTVPVTVNQNRTLHLLQKPDILICYRQEYPLYFRAISGLIHLTDVDQDRGDSRINRR